VNGNDINDCKSAQTAWKTIGHAISLASSWDTITVAPATYTENLTIGINLKVIGSSASTTIIDGGGIGTVVTICATNVRVRLSKLTIRNGLAGGGGGIYNNGTLIIDHCTISGNRAYDPEPEGFTMGGGIDNGSAGYGATLTINNRTISGNSTNSRRAFGGGINHVGIVTINSSTISDNNKNINDGGAGIDAMVTVQNTIVANNLTNCGVPMTSNGYDLSSDDTCNFNNVGDLNSTDPMLGPCRTTAGPHRPWGYTMGVLQLMQATRTGVPATRAICSRSARCATSRQGRQ
jgi:hypothetical protein